MSLNMKSMRSVLVLAFLLFVGSISAQTVKVTVKDSQGEAVIGASVIEQGTRNGGVTDFDGIFTINLTAGKPIVVSYIGMKTKTVNAKGDVTVVLEDDATTLQEVVAIGYGTMKRKDLTGSVASVTGDALTKVPVSNVSEALQGKLGGVNVISQDGRPGAEMSIRVRGGGSITQSNDPLFIVDGIAVSSIDDIPADQIESIDVLKDASSTAIYGARGANGVILVTTKGAKEGKAQVKYNMYYQVKAKPKMLELQDPYTYVLKQWEYFNAVSTSNGSKLAKYYGLGSANHNHLEEYKSMSGHNYMEDVFETGHMWNHDLSVSGGTDKTKYFASVNYTDDGATMKKTGYKRWNVNLKLQQQLAKTLKLDLDARYSETSTQLNPYSRNSNNNKYVYPWMFNMIDNPLGDGDPTHFGNGDLHAIDQYNPIAVIDDNNYVRKQQRIRLNSALTWNIINNLTAKTELGLSRFWTQTSTWIGRETGPDKGTSSARLAKGEGYNVSWTTTLNYDFADILKTEDHKLNLLLGNEVLGSRTNTSTIYGVGYPEGWGEDQAFGQIQMSTDRVKSSYTNSIGVPSHTTSWFGRVNYNLLSRYMFTFTMRADGSSKFAEGNRWGYFPAGAIAWRISDEPFLAGAQKWLDNLKLRLSIGTSGNDGIDANAFIDEWNSTQSTATGYFSYTKGDIKGNPDLTWETTISRNAGLDYSFLNGKFNGSIDFYWNTTKDCLMKVPYDPSSGFTYQFQNVAKTSNKGIEFAFNYHIIDKKDFNLSFGLTYNYNVNKVEKVTNASLGAHPGYASTSLLPYYPYAIQEGEPVGLLMGFESDGFYTLDDFKYDATNGFVLNDGVPGCDKTVGAAYYGYTNGSGNKVITTPKNQYAFPGMPKYKDQDGDGQITSADVTVIGRMAPKHTGGFNFSGKYKSIDFNANFAYQLDGKVFNANFAKSVYSGTADKAIAMSRLSSKFDDSWRLFYVDNAGDLQPINTPELMAQYNSNAKYGLLGYTSSNAIVSSDYIESAAFLRLQSITIGYTFPKTLVSKIGLSNARVYVTGGNLFCISGYKGLDPDVNTVSSTMDSAYSGFPTPGYDYNAYPKSRTFTFGLNVAF